MNYRSKVRYSKLALGLAIALASAPAMAQNTTANIGGRVTAANEAIVAGAQVTITHVPSGTVSQAVTDANGRYVARGLRVGGPYLVTITKDGQTETIENVFLKLAETTQVDAAIGAPETTLEAVEVTAASMEYSPFSSTAIGSGSVVTRDQLEGYASISRNLQDYARFDARISQTDKERGEISVAGQNSRYNTVTIDGVNTSDTFGLEANNLPTIKQPISIDAIEEVQVNVANIDVTQRGYTGANINAVTKSGGNEFKGSVYYVYRDDAAAGEQYVRSTNSYLEPAPFEERTYGFNLGGPIIKDRLFFFASYEDFLSSRATDPFTTLTGSGVPVYITQAAVDSAINTARTTWGMDIGALGSSSANETEVKDKLIKLDWNIAENHRASLRYNETEQADPITPGFGTRGLSLSSHWYTQTKAFESAVGQWFADWSDNFSTEFRASRRTYDSIPQNNSRLPAVELQFTGSTPAGFSPVGGTRTLRFGTEPSRHFNELETDTDTLFFAGNLFIGDHELKAGFDYERTDFRNAFLQNIYGNYQFGCVNSSASFSYQFNGGAAINCATATSDVIEQAVLENFRRGRVRSYQAQIALPGRSVFDAEANFELGNLGFFVQDTWAVNYNLTVVAGFRVDRTMMPDEPLFNPAAAAAAGPLVSGRATGGFLRDNRVTLDGEMLFQPRVGLNYTFDTERQTQLRAGVGLYQGSAANVWLSNAYSNTGFATFFSGCGTGGFAACPTTGVALFNPNPDTQAALAGIPPAANVDFLDENLDQPSVWKANIALEHELPFWGAIASVEYIKTVTEDGLWYQHMNLGAPTAVGTDGRPLFWNAGGFNTACFNASNGNTVTTGVCSGAGAPRARAQNNAAFNNVMLATGTKKGDADNFTVSLFRPRQNDAWSWSLSYSFTDATDVNPLGSSVAYSSWIGRASFDPNAEEEARSPYVTRDRIIGNLSWKHAFFGDYSTEVGLFYEGRSGKPYSWTYNNDMNGDGVIGNDLMYIPTAFGSGEVVFAGGAAAEQQFWDIVNSNDSLSRYAGRVVERSSATSEWVNTFDLRVKQDLPGFMDGHKAELVLDILNVGNLLNKEWGWTDELAFQGSGTNSIGGNQARSFVNYLGRDSQGRYIYGLQNLENLTIRNRSGESAWAAQLTLRYSF
ncbi:TonB-dependent receptor [Silanimonas sp.]|jgi:hypothetical protein|uniref:TonB-dependent receptor n=1 Tax=Silanimonas sp. TaxID=1929290 RepID=UPI0022C9EED1|nr:TonB-dependent receptor [Silanimonas sp.]MCZ8116438.1 TonB-dependent receptor [Silanimonas sp.]